MAEQLLTAREVAHLLNVEILTVYRWVKNKKIPYVRLARNLRFRPADIDEWIKENEGRDTLAKHHEHEEEE